MYGICLLTYNRFKYAERTLNSVLNNLIDEEVRVHIASDGDTDEYLAALVDVANSYSAVKGVSVSNSQRHGYGANYNLATQSLHENCNYMLMLEDDWEATQSVYIAALAADMRDLGVGCARLGYIGFTQELRARFAFAQNSRNLWVLFDPDSPEPHVFAGHPRIESRAWSRMVGPWPTDRHPGETEFAVAHIPAARQNVGMPTGYLAPGDNLFVHIGTDRSY